MKVHGDFSGQFEGIGASVEMRNRQAIIVAPLPNTPASRAGIRPGDLVLSVDGQSLADKSLLEVVLLIRGARGTEVTLEIVHEGDIASNMVTMVRETIGIESASWKILEPEVGYIRVSTFVAPTGLQLQEAIKAVKAQGAKRLVLDLRNNGGGLLNSAVDVASQFLGEGLVLSSVDGAGKKTEHAVLAGGLATDIPMVVLVNGNSASAAEIVAGALQDQGRAKLVGTATFGKGSVTWLLPLRGGSGLNFTVSRWLTPNGRLIEGNGLEPDVLVGTDGASSRDERVQRLYRLVPPLCDAYTDARQGLQSQLADPLERLCNPPSPTRASDSDDAQLERAVQLLKEQRYGAS
jgi:carboxyl-terminal processing protease